MNQPLSNLFTVRGKVDMATAGSYGMHGNLRTIANDAWWRYLTKPPAGISRHLSLMFHCTYNDF